MTSYATAQAKYADMLEVLAEDWYTMCCHFPYESLYLCGEKDSAGVWVKLSIQNDTGALPCVRPERLPKNATKEMMVAMFRDWLRREPLAVFAY